MGLDAVVYCSCLRNGRIHTDSSTSKLVVDQETGETYTLDDSHVPHGLCPHEGFEAMHKRLGNISAIVEIRDAIRSILPDNSILLKKVVYSGIHAGDTLDLEDIATIEGELEVMADRIRPCDRVVDEFLKDMNELCGVAKEQENPIVFE